MKVNASVVLLMLTALFISMAGKAQTDSLHYSTETPNDSTVEYLTPMEYAFMFHEETNWLFKASLATYKELGRNADNLKLGLEKKIANGFSLNAVLFNAGSFNLGLPPYENNGIEFSIESRWYYKNKENIQANKPTANLSGAYFAMGAGYLMVNKIYEHSTGDFNLDFMPVYAKWGVQRRFLKQGFVDVGLKAGWNKSLMGDSWSTLFFNTYVDAGLAFTKDRYKLNLEKLCPVLRCHAEDHFLLKTNLVNIINLAYVRESLIGSISPNIEAELKLGTSPFSINTKLGSKFEYSKIYEEVLIIEPQLTVEGRYFYNLQRRMFMGKSGNGLSANYISMGVAYQGLYVNKNNNKSLNRERNSFIGVKVGTGIQRLISDHLYFDINIGGAYGMEYSYDDRYLSRRHSNEPRLILDLGFGVGYRF